MLDDPAVEIAEISVPPWAQLDIACKAIAAGKHLLCQKPLSDKLSQAAEIVRLAREKGVKLAVNQQLRWGQGLRAARTLIRKGWIGRPTDASIQVSVNTPWDMWPWLAAQQRLEILYHTIHYIDAIRSLFGDPEWITTRHTPLPAAGRGQGRDQDDHDPGLRRTTCRRSSPTTTTTMSDDYFAVFRFIGTEGVITGTLGAMYNYPRRPARHAGVEQPAPLPGQALRGQAGRQVDPRLVHRPTASLMQAIQEDGVPETDGFDNLQTLRVVEACYLSPPRTARCTSGECEAIPCRD